MKKLIALLLAVLMLAGCVSVLAEKKPFEGQTLTVSTYSFNAELLQKNIYDPFMAATGAKLVIETGKNAERVTKIAESPANYDVVVIGDLFVRQLMEAGAIEKVDPAKLTNLNALYEVARAPMGAEYGPAYNFTRLGIVVNTEDVKTEVKSWADLWKPELAGSIAIPAISTTSGPLFYYATAKAFNLKPGVDDEAIFAKLAELKPNVVATYTSANNTITMLNQGEISVAVLLDYSFTAAKKANEAYQWVEPSEGSFVSYNMINIVKGSKNMDLAHAFIDFYLSKEVQLAEAMDGVDAPTRMDVELDSEHQMNFIYGADMVSSLNVPDWDLISSKLADWTASWNTTFGVK